MATEWRFYVYALFDGDETVYVGKGSGNRLRQSEKFRGFGGVEIARFCDEQAAYDFERDNIKAIRPRLNSSRSGGKAKAKDYIPMMYQGKVSRQYVAKWLLEYSKSRGRFFTASDLEVYRQVLNGPRC